jgi:hypothetical protein
MDLGEALELLRSGESGVAQWNLQRHAGVMIPSLDSSFQEMRHKI